MCSAGFDLSLSSFAPMHDGFGDFMQTVHAFCLIALQPEHFLLFVHCVQ